MAIFFAFLLGVAAILLLYTLFDLNQRAFLRETGAVLSEPLDALQRALPKLEPQARLTLIQSELEANPNAYLALIDASGAQLAGNLPFVPPPEQRSQLTFNLFMFHAVVSPNVDEEQVLIAVKLLPLLDNQQLWIGRDITAIRAHHRKVDWLIACILFLLLVVILTSFFVSTFVVGRINNISQTAQQIMETGDLSRRIDVDSTWDDLGNLAALLNIFLARIEALMQAVRDVSDNIAHDLRTPLTRLRNQLDASKARIAQGGDDLLERLTQDYETLLAEADQLLGVFNAILRLTNIEKGRRAQPFEAVAVNEVLQDVVELYQALVEDKGVQLNADVMVQFVRPADRDLLFQVFANLLDNAVKFTPTGGTIFVNLVLQRRDDAQNGCCITIADSGCGIPLDEQDKVFDRFYRADRSRNKPGSGLGLSLVRAALELHDGGICLEDNAPGLKCLIYL